MLSCRGYAIAHPCLRSVAPLGLTIHTTLSRTRVLMGAVHSYQGGRPAGFTTCLYSVALTALYFVSSVYPRRCLGLTSYALCFPLRTANFVFSALFRLELTYNLLDAYHSPFCLYAKVKKGRYRPANRGQRAVRKTKCYGLFRLRYDSGLSLFQFFACATK